jgi:hypothetical protein
MSRDLFLMMREEEVQTSNFLPTKKEIQSSSIKFITEILEAGETDKFELLAQAKRMIEALDVINTELLKVIPQENFEAYGLKGTFRSGGDTINYSDDEVYATIKKDLDARTEQLKMALKQDTFDAYGNQVPRVSTTPRKSSVSITF